jgi:predicted nuclease of predicted toxin-antitoxin system
MRILANENFPGPVVHALRQRGEDVAWVKEDQPGAADDDVLARAQAERRLLVTLDKDFGELACRFGLPADCGVILFRLNGASPEEDNARALAALASRLDWAGHLAVVQDDRIRLRPLPQAARLPRG